MSNKKPVPMTLKQAQSEVIKERWQLWQQNPGISEAELHTLWCRKQAEKTKNTKNK